jgi:Flp pilus assembly protein TadB
MTAKTLRTAVAIEGGLIAAVFVCAFAAVITGGGAFNVLGPLLLLCALLGVLVIGGMLIARVVTHERQRRAYEKEWGRRR